MTDTILLDILEVLELQGTVYFQADFEAPWGMAISQKDVAAFHIVAKGSCWLRCPTHEPIPLERGSIVLIPDGGPHELVHSPEGEALPAEVVVGAIADRPSTTTSSRATNLICGHFSYEHELHPFFKSLPSPLHVNTNRDERAAWIRVASELATYQAHRDRPGSRVVLDRLAEALLLQTLVLFLDQTPHPEGFVAAAAEPRIGRALAAIHAATEHGWSLQELAETAGMSKSAFSETFRSLVGETPMRYLARWRMLAARKLLRRDALTVAQVATRVGYQSEFAFSKAFKRFYGRSPGQARRAS